MGKNAVIIGAGPAGLTAALELLRQTDIKPIVLEESSFVGGISRTVNNGGNRMDIGGHRFFSKNQQVMEWWETMMPIQGSPSLDDILLERPKELSQGGPDPEKEDRVMLVRDRVSRIFFLRHFFDYPISLKWSTFAGMGLWNTMRVGFGYIKSAIHKLPETSLENFYVNKFGRPLYEMFFEDYTEKVWGVHPSKIGADWGAQRVKGLSVMSILKDVLTKPFRKKSIDQQKVETSLIERFIYPKYGPGQLWETVAGEVVAAGGELRLSSKVKGIIVKNGAAESVEVETPEGMVTIPCDYLFSSMPVRDLVSAIKGVDIPAEVSSVASGLPYRDFITVGVLASKLKITNGTKIKTYEGRVPDTWIYVQERDVKVGRLQIFNNWSPYMVSDYKGTMYVGMEYFCDEGDDLWEMTDHDFIEMALGELEKIGVVDRNDVMKADRIKVKKAYPAYFGTYKEIHKVREWLDGFSNLFCIGRNGQHRYNNMDHSMLTAMEAVRCVKDNLKTKDNVWEVNTEKEYHESK